MKHEMEDSALASASITEKIKFVLEHLRDVPDAFKESTEMMKKWLMRPDPDGLPPEIFVSISNRTGGKTYFVAYLLMELWMKFGTTFMLLARTGTELGNTAGGIFSSVLEEFPGFTIVEQVRINNVYSEIMIIYDEEEVTAAGDGESTETKKCKETLGYVLAINASDKIKKISSMFYDSDIMFMDEFQADKYVPKEVDKFANIHMSVARGHGKASRYVPVIMCSNSLSIINPYFSEWHLDSKIQENTKFYRESGLSLLRFVNDEVAKQQSESRFNTVFKNNRQINSNITNSWLNDSRSCISKPAKDWGNRTYVATFIADDSKYALRVYDNGIYYVNRSVDETHNNVYALSVDGSENVECARRSVPLLCLRDKFLKGMARFSDLQCKVDMLKWI